MSKTMMQAGQMGVQKPSLMRCPRGFVGTLETLGGRFFGLGAQAARITEESAMARGVMSETMVSDIDVIAKSPQNTSGFYTYIAQVAVIVSLF